MHIGYNTHLLESLSTLNDSACTESLLPLQQFHIFTVKTDVLALSTYYSSDILHILAHSVRSLFRLTSVFTSHFNRQFYVFVLTFVNRVCNVL